MPLSSLLSKITAQNCPANIDFETGTFGGWTCYTGFVAAVGTENAISLFNSGGPVPDRHTMLSPYSGGVDPYGGFPVNCPNGSGYSIRLGNNMGGGEAEAISYEFTIPAGRDVYNLIYHYAVVFQDPNHQPNEQPRMEIEILNVTDNLRIDCSSFTFYPYGSPLPGFQVSPNPGSDTPVWFKDWSAVSINLNGHAGKTIRLMFKTADCTFRRHFGYAYIDVNSECSDEFTGATFCRDDTTVNVVAPYGYQSYTWYNTAFTQVLGNQQTLPFTPPPPPGTVVAVELLPYNGYGCLDTLYARLVDTLSITSNAGADILSCNQEPVLIGGNAKPGLVYSWDPATDLTSSVIANPLASPALTTQYILTTRNSGGGCVDTDTVIVTASTIISELTLTGKAEYCVDSGDSTILSVQPTDHVQWYRDDRLIAGATQSLLRVTESGNYHAVLSNTLGCKTYTVRQPVLIDIPLPGITYPVEFAVMNLQLPLKARAIGEEVQWSPASQLDNALSYSPMFKGATEQLYLIKLTARSGCVTIDTQLVKTIEKVEVYVPTGFTPNSDGRNDFLRPIMRGVKQLRYFRVFNRHGELVFDIGADERGWNGIFKGTQQSTQVVVWMMEGTGVDGVIHRRKGTSVLIR